MRIRKILPDILRRAVFLLLITTAYIVQCTLVPRTAFPFPIFLLIPLVISVSMFEYEFSGLIFGMLTGALWDLASPLPDGLLAFLFAFIAGVCGLLSHYVLRNTLFGALLLSGITSVTYSLICALFFSSDMNFYDFKNTLLYYYLPAVIIVLLLTVPFYFFIRALSVRLRHDKITT